MKAVGLTSGGLRRVRTSPTERGRKARDRGAEVSRGHCSQLACRRRPKRLTRLVGQHTHAGQAAASTTPFSVAFSDVWVPDAPEAPVGTTNLSRLGEIEKNLKGAHQNQPAVFCTPISVQGPPTCHLPSSKVGAGGTRPDFLTNFPAASQDGLATGRAQRLGRRPVLLMDPAPVNVVPRPASGEILVPQACQVVLLEPLHRPAVGRKAKTIHPR